MLLIGTSGAWAKYNQPAVDLYFDNSEAQWDNCRVYIGHDKWLAFYNMSRVSGTEHLWKLSSDFNSGNSWNDATHWGFTSDYWEAKEQSVIKIVYTGDKKFTYDNTNTVDEEAWTNDKIYKTNGTANVTLDNQTKKAYKINSRTKSNYTVTINSEIGGTLTVNDYDNNTVSNGASKIYLTVLKFSASASDGYTLEEVQIYDGSTTTTISAEDLASTTYTLKSAVTITPAWKKTCTPPDAPELTNPDAQCGRSITLPATYNEFTLKWYDENGSVVNNTTITSSGTYYAAAVGECESIERTRYIITINPVPSFTTEPSSVTLCSSATAISVEKLIVETGAKADNSATIELYDANNNKVTGDINISTASQTEYKLKASTTTCSSEDKTFTLTIKATPTPPTVEPTSVEICPNGQVTITATGDVNTQKYQLYKKVSETEYNKKGSEQTDNIFTITEAGYYKVKGINGECRSEYSDRIEITEITAPEAPSIEIGKANICAGVEETYILVKEPQEGYTYTLFNNGTEVNGATLNTENKFIIFEAGNYTVKVTAPTERCSLTSAASEEKTLTVTSVSLALDPTSAPICSGKTIADIANYVKATATVTPSGAATISWYATEKATVALTNATVLEAKTYYAEAATQSGCKSERKSFEVTSLLNAPSAPVIKSNKYAVCSGESVELTLEYKRVGETYTINDINNTEVFKKSNTWSTPALNSKTDYIVTATNSCGSTNSEKLTINVTTTPVITANKLVTTIGSPITLTSNIDAIWTTTGGILNPNSGAISSVEFTSQNNGRYIITASNTANDITCSASEEVSVQNAFYVYIRRPKSGDNVYNDWYGKTNDAEKGNAPWFKEGTPNYDSMEDTNYGGVGPVESFTDCNDYTWDAFEFAGGNFYIHAPNTSSSDGWATFTRETYIASLTGDVYYYISSFKSGEKGAILSIAQTPERTPEIETPIVSLNPASGILCSGSQATLTVTNPQNDYTYTLMYKGTAQGEPISGNNEVEFTVIEAGSYAVQAKVQSNSGCTSTASSSASQIKVIATDIKFDATEYTTTPWVPVTVVIEVPSGYEFTYNDATLTSITPEADKPIKKENGHEYTYTFPRPTDWGIGNSQSGDGYDEKPYTITATIKNAEQCGTATATVKLQDEGNDSCTLPNQ